MKKVWYNIFVGDIMQNFKILKQINNIGSIKQYLIESCGKKYILSHAVNNGENNVILRASEVMKALSGLLNIPKVIDCWEKNNNYYLIEEYVNGKKLTKENVSRQDLEQIVNQTKKLHSIRCENTIDKCLILAKMHMDNNLLNLSDFVIDGKDTSPQSIFDYLVKNKEVFKNACMLHGDLSLNNMVKGNDGKIYLINWFNCIYGDFYYDLASLAWTLNGEDNIKLFELYGETVDAKRLLYADYLSKFLKIN